MSFLCPLCTRPALYITHYLRLPPDCRSDDIIVQLVTCSHCSFSALAVYEESRRGALDDDSFSHQGYYLPPKMLNDLRELLESCPEPDNTRCNCPAHETLNIRDKQGCWRYLEQLPHEGAFIINMSATTH